MKTKQDCVVCFEVLVRSIGNLTVESPLVYFPPQFYVGAYLFILDKRRNRRNKWSVT